MAQTLKRLPAARETQVWSLGWEDPLEKEMATHSSILAWKIPWTEEPGGLQSMWLQRVGHDWDFTFTSQTGGQQDLIHLTTPDGLDNVGQEKPQHPASGSVNMRIYFLKKQFIISLHFLNLCFPRPVAPLIGTSASAEPPDKGVTQIRVLTVPSGKRAALT